MIDPRLADDYTHKFPRGVAIAALVIVILMYGLFAAWWRGWL